MITQVLPDSSLRSAPHFLILLALMIATIVVPSAKSLAEGRIALVIGNGAYATDPLSNPANDAELMSRTLRNLGFKVEEKTDVNEKTMRRLIQDFGQRLKRQGGVGVFYYSGHGMQVNGRNYMIPVDAEIKHEVDVKSDGVAANEVLWWMERSGSDRNMVILDACRDNPFEKSFKSGRKGLARMDAPTGTLIAYAAAPGAVADQGPKGGYSPFTKLLAKEIVVAGLDARILFDNVSVNVLNETNDRQRPYVESSAFGKFYFSAPVSPTTPQKVKPAVGVYPPTYRVGDTFRDCDTCPEMVVVPAGSFQMGSPTNEMEQDGDEGPVPYSVRIAQPFAVGVNEVTNGEFVAFLNAVGRRGPANEPWFETKGEDDHSKIVSSGGNRYGVESGYENHPVVNVSWYGARAYTDWLSKKTDEDYRLLTEAEWEYVARAETKTRYSFGDAITDKDANFYGNVGKTTKVGSYPANAWGLHDLHGNVWEWVADCYDTDAYETHKNYPAMVGSWQDSCYRVLRGGSWFNDPRNLRSAIRGRNLPDDRIINYGFRVARTL